MVNARPAGASFMQSEQSSLPRGGHGMVIIGSRYKRMKPGTVPANQRAQSPRI